MTSSRAVTSEPVAAGELTGSEAVDAPEFPGAIPFDATAATAVGASDDAVFSIRTCPPTTGTVPGGPSRRES